MWRDTHRSLVTDSNIVRKGSHSAKMAVRDTDIPIPGDPRSQLGKERLFCEGVEAWIADSIYLDGLPTSQWLMVSEHGFAEPWYFPALSLQAESGLLSLWHHSGKYTHERLGSTPALNRQWMDTVMHVKFSKYSSLGFVELYVNGNKILGPTYRNTINPDATDCGWAVINNYRAIGYMDTYTLYHDEFKVGTSYSAVAP